MAELPEKRTSQRFASAIFLAAALYGTPLLVYWMFKTPGMVGRARGQQPEMYYGFGSIGLAWQAVFILIATDPVRYRPLMLIAAVLEKLFFAGLLVWLLVAKIAGLHWVPFAVADGLLGIGFLIAWWITPA
jgi:hypothetical protein